MLNPNKYIRQAIIQAIAPLKCWTVRVPKNEPTPTEYVILNSETQNEYVTSKTEYEWLLSINLDVTVLGQVGFDNTTKVDDMIEDIIPAVKSLKHPLLNISNVTLQASNTLNYDTTTNSVNRKVLTFEIWVGYAKG